MCNVMFVIMWCDLKNKRSSRFSDNFIVKYETTPESNLARTRTCNFKIWIWKLHVITMLLLSLITSVNMQLLPSLGGGGGRAIRAPFIEQYSASP